MLCSIVSSAISPDISSRPRNSRSRPAVVASRRLACALASRRRIFAVLALAGALAAAGCSRGDKADPKPDEAADKAGAEAAGGPAIATDHGVDVANKVITIGALNDESGPAAIIGKPYAAGKRLLVAEVNAGGSGILPDGWTVELVERDHQYNPQKAVQAYNAIKNQVLFIATSFGTPNTLPLRTMLERDQMLAFPASLSSAMAEHPHTPPNGPSYRIEVMRGVDFAVEQAGGADKVKAGIVYQKDDYGKDGLEGLREAAAGLGIEIVSETSAAPGQKDYTAVVTALKDAGATHVWLAVLASATGPILGTAAQLGYQPMWLGSTPAWIDRFYDPSVLPAAVFANYYQLLGLPYWGEELPGMKQFLAAYEAHGADLHPPDSYLLGSYLQGRIALEAARRAIEGGDITRKRYMETLRSLSDFTAAGLLEQPVDFTAMPYVTSTQVRVLKPDFEARSWTVAADYARPTTIEP